MELLLKVRRVVTTALMVFLVLQLSFTQSIKNFQPIPSAYAQGVTRVQGPVKGVSAGTISITLSQAPGNGNFLVLTYANYFGSTISSITETGVTWASVVTFSDSSNGMVTEIWLGTVGSGAGTSITVASSSYAIANVCEYSGLTSTPTDQIAISATGKHGTSPTDTGTTATTTQAAELWIGATTVWGGSHSTTQSSPTNGFTLLDGADTTFSGYHVSQGYLEEIVSATGTANTGTTVPTSGSYPYWDGAIATFKASGPPPPDFMLTANPTSQSVSAGSTASTTLSLTPLNGFTSTVTLTVTSGCPSGVTGLTCTVSPTPISYPTTATLNVVTSSSATQTTYSVVVTGTSGSLSHTATFTVTVTAPPPGPTITANPSTVSVIAGGQSGTSTLTLTGFPSSGTVNLSVSGCPTGVTCAVNPTSLTLPTQTTSTLTVTASAIAATSLVQLTVSATGAATAQATVPLSVTGAPQQSFTVHPGATQVVVTVTWTGTPTTTSLTLVGPNNNPVLSESGQTVFDRFYVTGSTITYIHKVTFNISSYSPSSTQTWNVVIPLSGTYTVTIDVNSPAIQVD